MPAKNQFIVNPVSGDTFQFMETAKTTFGKKVVLKAMIKTKGKLVPKHYHLFQEETFEVLSGKLTFWFKGETIVLEPGEKIILPKNIPHNHYNNHDLPVTYLHTITPALDFDYLIENLVGLAADGNNKNGKFGLIQELVSLKYLDSKTYLAAIPIGIQKLLANSVAPIGRLFGYRAIYKKYSDIEK